VMHVFFFKKSRTLGKNDSLRSEDCIAGEDPGRRSEIERKAGTGFE
jgi:hypothetical protein